LERKRRETGEDSGAVVSFGHEASSCCRTQFWRWSRASLCFSVSLLLLFFPFRVFDEKKSEEKLSFNSLGIWFCRQGGLADGGFCREHSGRIVIIQRSLLEGSGFANKFFSEGFCVENKAGWTL
jgi:hypothetical protein